MKQSAKNTVATVNNIVMISLASIQTSSFNPRSSFPEAELNELAENIKKQGLLQAIVVRPTKEKNIYEIVCGERRYRASQIAGLSDIPATVRDLSDDKAREVAISENLLREDISPIEEATAFQKLLDTKHYSISDLTTRFGKSEAFVRGRLRLNNLIPEITDLLAQELISIGSAEEISKYGTDIQEEIFNQHLGDNFYNSWLYLPVKDLSSRIERNYSSQLTQYYFDKADCLQCAHNSNNQNLFAENKSCGCCLNRSCLKDKNNEYMINKVITLSRENPLSPIFHTCFNYNENVIEMLKGQEYETTETKYIVNVPMQPEEPQEDEYEERSEYEEAVNEYNSDLTEYTVDMEAFNQKIADGIYSTCIVIGNNDVVVKFREIKEEALEVDNTLSSEMDKLAQKDKRNKEIAAEKIIEDTKKIIRQTNLTGDFSLDEEKMLYYFMLPYVGSEHYKSLGVDEEYYDLSEDKKLTIINNLTEDIKAIIRRDYLVYNFKDAYNKQGSADLLLTFARQHVPEEVAEIEKKYNDIYNKRHSKIEEKMILLQAKINIEDPKK